MVCARTTLQELNMGKGDKRSLRGKIYKGSYGNARPHKARKTYSKSVPAKK